MTDRGAHRVNVSWTPESERPADHVAWESVIEIEYGGKYGRVRLKRRRADGPWSVAEATLPSETPPTGGASVMRPYAGEVYRALVDAALPDEL